MAPAAKEPTNSDSRPGSPEPEAKSSAPGEERLEKDRFDSENNPIETSDEDVDESTSSDEEAVHEDDSDVKRGRKKAVEQEVPVNTGPKPLTTTKTAPEFRTYSSLFSILITVTDNDPQDQILIQRRSRN